MSGPARSWDSDELFVLWHNAGGRRRSMPETIAAWRELHPDADPPSVRTLEAYSSDDDWSARAQALDAEVRKQSDGKLAEMIATHRANVIKVGMHVCQLYAGRYLMPEGDPARLDAGDVHHRDWVEVVKLLELMTGGATERTGMEGVTVSAEEIAAELEEIEVRALQREAELAPARRELPPVLDDQARRLVRNPTAPEPERVPSS